MRKAFTLIELLVVIAIIAILAAILFPVFAQAKAAAKKAASISNSKQINTGEKIYQGDYDDVIVIGDQWDSPDAPLQIAGVLWAPWVYLVQPYIKSADIMQDPQGPNIPNTAFPRAIQTAVTPTYNLNYFWLTPCMPSGSACIMTPVSETAIANPAATVMTTTRFEQVSESTLPYNSLWWFGARTTTWCGKADPPITSPATIPQWGFSDWGTQSWFYTTSTVKNYAAGRETAGSSIRGAEIVVVSFTDGSAKAMKPNALGAGTTWRKGAAFTPPANGLPTDLTKYIWDTQ